MLFPSLLFDFVAKVHIFLLICKFFGNYFYILMEKV